MSLASNHPEHSIIVAMAFAQAKYRHVSLKKYKNTVLLIKYI